MPFVKHRLNPVLNSGHETTFFPFKNGIAGLAIKDGNERNTMQYAADGVNFEIADRVANHQIFLCRTDRLVAVQLRSTVISLENGSVAPISRRSEMATLRTAMPSIFCCM